MPDYSDIIEKHAKRVGVDPNWMRKIMRIESGGDSKNVTGSYMGLFQLSKKEFKRHGGSGDILDPDQNAMAAANKLAQDKLDFKNKYGREASLKDIYMIHQQGEGGFAAHMANPDQPAWKSMLSTKEGREKGEKWAKAAIWGNVPDKDKVKFGSVDNITSKQFTDMWGARVEGQSFEGYGPLMAASAAAKSKGEVEGLGGTKRGSFLGEDQKTPFKWDTPVQGPEATPEMRLPSFASTMPEGSGRGPKIPGATRWEVG